MGPSQSRIKPVISKFVVKLVFLLSMSKPDFPEKNILMRATVAALSSFLMDNRVCAVKGKHTFLINPFHGEKLIVVHAAHVPHLPIQALI